MKKITFIFLLTSFTAFSQPFVSGEAGNRLGINAGYNYNNVVLKAGGLFPYTRTTTKSNITYLSAGYKIGFITPLIGISGYHTTEFKELHGEINPKEIRKTVVLYSLELGKNFTTINNNSYRLYLFGTHAENNFFGAGLRIKIK